MKRTKQFKVLIMCAILIVVGCSKEEESAVVPAPVVVETCSDGIMHQNETGIDCGGVCTACVVPVAPCSPLKNTVNYNLQQQTFSSVNAGTGGLFSGNYGLVATGTSSDLQIGFSQAPITGEYTTVGGGTISSSSECDVTGVFGSSITYRYFANAGDKVYVTKNGNGLYSMTFCNLNFTSSSTTFTFSTDGNLTSE